MKQQTAAAFLAAVVVFLAGSSQAQDLLIDGQGVKVHTKPIETFHIGHEDTVFGKLTFLGGLEIIASDRKVGGLSGLVSLDNGNRFMAVTDNGHWVTGAVAQSAEGAPTDISDVRFSPLRNDKGQTLRRQWGHDTEALALASNSIYVSAERNHAIYRYEWPISSGNERMIGQLSLPKSITTLPGNTGIESLALPPKGSALDGQLIAVSETSESDAHNLSGYIFGPDGHERFWIKRLDRFDATDAAFLPNGDLILMERRFNLRDLIGLRLRRFAGDDIKAGAILDGELLLEADFNYQIDNMEAMAVHQNGQGETILTLLSDNNRSLLQRTVFLRFRLDD